MIRPGWPRCVILVPWLLVFLLDLLSHSTTRFSVYSQKAMHDNDGEPWRRNIAQMAKDHRLIFHGTGTLNRPSATE